LETGIYLDLKEMTYQYKGRRVEVLMVRKGMKSNWGFIIDGKLSPQRLRNAYKAKEAAEQLIDYQQTNPDYNERP
jgi:hypothetical protein